MQTYCTKGLIAPDLTEFKLETFKQMEYKAAANISLGRSKEVQFELLVVMNTGFAWLSEGLPRIVLAATKMCVVHLTGESSDFQPQHIMSSTLECQHRHL